VASETQAASALAIPRPRGRPGTVYAQIAQFARRKPLAAFGAVVLLVLILMAIFADVVTPFDPMMQNQAEALQKPSARHLAGTDQFGRDVFSRIVLGARTSLTVGVGVTFLALVPAIALGMASAFLGGWVDYALQRFVDTVQSIPGLIMLIATMVVLGPSLHNIIIALAFRRAITESRVMRGSTLGIMNQTYVEAARAVGASSPRIMVRHLVPNIMPIVIIIASLGFGGVILAEASLSFLGYGVPPPTPSWGGMIAADGRSFMYAAPWMLVGPGAALALVVFGVNMFGDGIRDVLDPRLRGS
jgi:peptide/nickel transport system permease protein